MVPIFSFYLDQNLIIIIIIIIIQHIDFKLVEQYYEGVFYLLLEISRTILLNSFQKNTSAIADVT